VVDDAARRGVPVDIIGGGSIEQLRSDPNFPLVLLIDPPLDSAAMQEELFGPVLPIVSYDTLEEVARQVRSGERPLALYFLGGNKEQQEYLLRNTWAGGVTFDDFMLHAIQQDLPFGGVGESGMGRYGGHAGFKTFSNAKAVAHPPRINLMKMEPPYTAKMVATIRGLLKP
jgi:coniferyl-aldehyde dehydrogenase